MTVTLGARDVAAAETLLRLAGAAAVTLADGGDDPVLEPRPGTVELWPSVRLTALFESDVDADALAAVLGRTIELHSAVVDEIGEEDWSRGLVQPADDIPIAPGLRIVPAQAGRAGPGAGRVVLNIGLAFGTGHHPTTRLCLEWLAGTDVRGADVLDFGCGSGILGIAALSLGAARVHATDNDPQALIATRENAQLNRMLDRVWIGDPSAMPAIAPDLILANILASTLEEHAPRLAAMQPPGGRIVLSGILADQLDAIAAAFGSDYDRIETAELDGWIRMTAARR